MSLAGCRWPVDPLKSGMLKALGDLGMPRFTRRYPRLCDSIVKQVVEMAHCFEAERAEEQPKTEQYSATAAPCWLQVSTSDLQEFEAKMEEEQQKKQQQQEQQAQQPQQQQDTQGQAQSQEGDAAEGGQPGEQMKPEQTTDDISAAMEKIADDLVQQFEQEWKPAAENMEKATKAFDDLKGLMDGPEGFDSSLSVWQSTGWAEVESLRKKLEDLPELRELVRQLGRAGGVGPLRRAPEEVRKAGRPPGLIRSPLQPEETRGIARSGDLSRMLPFEAHLMAAGPEGSRAARLLHMVRRVERNLMSYERTGWLQGEPTRVTARMEIRPAAEMGPIICCLDTSGSMAGARETVAKAVALECMRGAHRQERQCYLYAFSGPGQVMELELDTTAKGIRQLLDFLSGGFTGGTDVDKPLELSLKRLTDVGWTQADILMVTDGEIPMPSKDICDKLKTAKEELGLEVHGLMVGRSDTTPAMEAFCSHLHVFQSWGVLNTSRNAYAW
eukprot:jgi/Astpho2/1609/e_gw1.00028.9.1_t